MPPAETPHPGSSAALDKLPATRRAILVHLRQSGRAGAAELARTLGITAGAVRQQVAVLARDGLVEHLDLRPGPGRPRRRYFLSPAGLTLFPQGYGDLAVEILGQVAAEDPALLERAFARRAAGRVEQARRRLDPCAPVADRVHELARILDEQGYMARCRAADGGLHLEERHCAIAAVARQHACACTSELGFLRGALPDARVERVSHMMAGERTCTYLVTVTEDDVADQHAAASD